MKICVDFEQPKQPWRPDPLQIIIFILVVIFCIALWVNLARADELKASWYSIQSLKDEGTWKTSKGVMANGKQFSDNNFTCATRIYPLGTILRITNVRNSKTVVVKVTDRIGKRFAKTRIDLSQRAFSQIASLEQGLVPIAIEVIKPTKEN